MEKAGRLLKEEMEEFYSWYHGKDLIPRIQEIKADAVEDFSLRVGKLLKKTSMEDEDRDNLRNAMDTAVGKVVGKMLFGLRDSLTQEEFLHCVKGLEKLYEE